MKKVDYLLPWHQGWAVVKKLTCYLSSFSTVFVRSRNNSFRRRRPWSMLRLEPEVRRITKDHLLTRLLPSPLLSKYSYFVGN